MRMVTEFVVTSTEASGGPRTLEASHRSVSSFDPTMVLLNPIIQISVGSVLHSIAQFGPDRARVTVVTVRRDARGNDAGHHFSGPKECFRRLHVARLAQPHVYQSAVAIDRTI